MGEVPSAKEVLKHFEKYSFVQDVRIKNQKKHKRYGVELKLTPCSCQDVTKASVLTKCVWSSSSRNLHGICKVIRQQLKTTHNTASCSYNFHEMTAFSALMSGKKTGSAPVKRPRAKEAVSIFEEGLEDLTRNFDKKGRTTDRESVGLTQLKHQILMILDGLSVLEDLKKERDASEAAEVVETKQKMKQLCAQLTTIKKQL